MSARQLGTVGMAGVVFWVASVVALHFLDSDLDVANTYVSDYALGDYGWLMQLAFVVVGIATAAIGWGLRLSLASGKRVTASVVLVLVAGIGFVVSGIFKTDPTGVDDLTTAGTIHLLSAVVLFLSLIISAWMLRGVFKRDESWRSVSPVALGFAVALTLLFLVSFGTPSDGAVGLTQRLFAGVIMIWLFVLGLNLRRIDAPTAKT
jgi:hypothetical membrane protein